MPTLKHKIAVDALDAAERCVKASAQFALCDPVDPMSAMRAAWSVLGAENLPSDVNAKIESLILTSLSCVAEARRTEQEETSQTLRAFAPYVLRCVAFLFCSAICAACFFARLQVALIASAAFALYCLGLGAPLKAVFKSFGRKKE